MSLSCHQAVTKAKLSPSEPQHHIVKPNNSNKKNANIKNIVSIYVGRYSPSPCPALHSITRPRYYLGGLNNLRSPRNVHGGAFVHGVAFVHARDRA
jgi:hypothetical protein